MKYPRTSQYCSKCLRPILVTWPPTEHKCEPPDMSWALPPEMVSITRADLERLQRDAERYYRVMDLLRDSMHMKHGLCEPRERRACTRCNATDDLAQMVSEYRGAPIIAASKDTRADLDQGKGE
jgi:hypothetical protein